jgi:glucose/arabinose dehydrogenase
MMHGTRRIAAALAAGAAMTTAAMAVPPMTVRLHATGLQQPLAITHAPGHDDIIYVLQRTGRVATVDVATGAIRSIAWIDITPRVRTFGDGGLLGIAFAPDFASSGHVYLYYSRQPDSQGTLVRFTVDPATRVVDLASETLILTYPRTPNGHNGGWIGFSPLDGYLYLGSGDGGTAANPDPINAAQTITGRQFQGKMLRLDPTFDDFPLDPSRNYRIPPSNPFVGTSNDHEIWAYGLRNPWRCSFDRDTGDLWIADVGQESFEEINVERAGDPGGRNYGWKCMEALACTPYQACVTCPIPGATDPYFAYDHGVGHSITGGVVYRGSAIPGLIGTYVCADWADARMYTIRSDRPDDFQDVTSMVEPGGAALLTTIAAIGEDAAGEVYLADWQRGRVLKLVPRPLGACCVPGGGCEVLSITECLAVGGTYAGDGSSCQGPEASCVGACCLPDGTCVTLAEAACAGASGTFGGPGAACDGTCGTNPCTGDFNQDGGVDGSDIFAFFEAWQQGDASADVSQDGGVDGADVEAFFFRWEAGC